MNKEMKTASPVKTGIEDKFYYEIGEGCAMCGTESVCCGDNYYGLVPNEQVEQRMRMRASQLPYQNVVVYCIGCVRAMQTGGKPPCYLPDLLFANAASPMTDTLDEYHTRLEGYISEH